MTDKSTEAGAVREPSTWDCPEMETSQGCQMIKHVGGKGDYVLTEDYDALAARLAAVEETHRMQLAAISVAATANTEESAKEKAIGRDNPYWTPSYGDVFYAVSREVKERKRAEQAESLLSDARNAALWIPVSEGVTNNCGYFLVTNNLTARDAFGNMSHVWLVQMIHYSKELGWFAFDEYDRKRPEGITHWMPLPKSPDPKERQDAALRSAEGGSRE